MLAEKYNNPKSDVEKINILKELDLKYPKADSAERK